MNIKTSAAVAALLAGLSLAAPARAADVYHREGSTKDEPASFDSPTVNWTGFYISGQAGGSFAVLGDADGQGGISVDGFTGGLGLGFDVQRGPFVFGISGEYNFSNAALEIGTFTLLEKDHDMSGCGRAGYLALPKVLAYIKGCYTRMELNSPVFGGSESFDGLGARAGIEFAAARNTFVGIEAGHTWFDEDDKLPSGVSLDETTIMGTLKVKLNGFGLAD